VRLREGESPEALVNYFRAAVQQAGILGEISSEIDEVDHDVLQQLNLPEALENHRVLGWH
jgi:hypothetical protein